MLEKIIACSTARFIRFVPHNKTVERLNTKDLPIKIYSGTTMEKKGIYLILMSACFLLRKTLMLRKLHDINHCFTCVTAYLPSLLTSLNTQTVYELVRYDLLCVAFFAVNLNNSLEEGQAGFRLVKLTLLLTWKHSATNHSKCKNATIGIKGLRATEHILCLEFVSSARTKTQFPCPFTHSSTLG